MTPSPHDHGTDDRPGHSPEHHQAHQHHGRNVHAPVREGVRDPVCGMTVDPHTTPHRTEHGGRALYFCSAGCRQRFETDPSRYFSPERAKQTEEPMPEGTVYTCPMHPEVRQTGPGSCPICGMALEPVMATADSGRSPELADMTRRFLDRPRAHCPGVLPRDGWARAGA
jgi:Cu+-exporting ATPase